jgi:hypothetical protein
MKHTDPYQIEWKSGRQLSKDGKEWYIIISIKNLRLDRSRVVQVVPEKVTTGRPFDNYKNWRVIVEDFENAKKLVWHFEEKMNVRGVKKDFAPDPSGNINADAIIYSYGETIEDYKKNQQAKPVEPVKQFDSELFEINA